MQRLDLEQEDGPDVKCLSYTHDDDYTDYLKLPDGVLSRPERMRQEKDM